MQYTDIIHFWFTELTPQDWWKKNNDFDLSIKNRFGEHHHSATALELFHWRETAHGCLAEIIILDQFSRNIYRNTAKSFACDGIALALAQTAVAQGLDQELNDNEKGFLYMPYMHSESLAIHDIAITLFEQANLANTLAFEHKHRNIIKRFQRCPHRNDILKRTSTLEEIEFLTTKESSF